MITEEEYQKLENVLNNIPFYGLGQAVEFRKVRGNQYHCIMIDNGRIHMTQVRL